MIRSNPFDGKGAYTKFVWACYKCLISREWFTYADVMANKEGGELKNSISSCPNYGELKKAFSDVRRLIEEKAGKGSIISRGNNRKKIFRYVGVLDNPLEDYQNSSAIKNIKTYTQFCLDSAGFIPKEWIEYFFEDTLDLLKIKRRRKMGEQFISSSIDRDLTNIHLLPLLYEAIREKKILKIKYKFAEKEELIFHPHLLKEYNGRWFLFGHAEGLEPEYGYNLPLDRIMGQPKIHKSAEFFNNPPKDFYKNFFKDIVGVTHDDKWQEVEVIAIRARNYRMFNLVNTKPFHHSQEVTKDYDKEEKYGEFKVKIKINNEFIGRILQLGAGIEIVSPPNVRELVKQRVSNMMSLYNQEENI